MHGDERMQVPHLNRCRRWIALLLLIVTGCASSWAQEPQPAQAAPASGSTPEAPKPAPQMNRQPLFQFTADYSKARGHFPNPLAPYIPRTVPLPNLANTPRIAQLMQTG